MEQSRQNAIKAKTREQLARNPLYQLPGWTDAHARLLALFPQARDIIDAPYTMTPDSILDAASDAAAVIESVLLYNPWRANPAGHGGKEFEEYDTPELFDVVFEAQPPSPGPLWFIPDDCFGHREPYVVQGEQLRDFVVACRCPLNQDVLFIWSAAPRVTLIHHEGGFFHIIVSPG